MTQRLTSNAQISRVLNDDGLMVEKEITLNANNTSASVSAFTITGRVAIEDCYIVVTDATSIANCTNGIIDISDGSDVAYISNDEAPLTLSSAVVDNLYYINTGFATDGTWSTIGATTVGLGNKTSTKKAIVNTKPNATNTVRFSYTTTSTPINAKIKLILVYKPIGTGTITPV